MHKMVVMKTLTSKAIENIASKYAGSNLNSFAIEEGSMAFGLSEKDSLRIYFTPKSLKHIFYAPKSGKSIVYTIDGRDPAPIFPDGTKGYAYEDFQKRHLNAEEIEKEMKKYPLKGMFFKITGLADLVNVLFSGQGNGLSGFVFMLDHGGIASVEYSASGISRRYIREGEGLIEIEPRIKVHLGNAILA